MVDRSEHRSVHCSLLRSGSSHGFWKKSFLNKQRSLDSLIVFVWLKRETTMFKQRSRKLCSVKIPQQVSGCLLSFLRFPLCSPRAITWHLVTLTHRGYPRPSACTIIKASAHNHVLRCTQWAACCPHWVYRKPRLQIRVDWRRTKSCAPHWPQNPINADHWYFSFN